MSIHLFARKSCLSGIKQQQGIGFLIGDGLGGSVLHFQTHHCQTFQNLGNFDLYLSNYLFDMYMPGEENVERPPPPTHTWW